MSISLSSREQWSGNVMVDCDGVICSFWEKMQAVFTERFGPVGLEDIALEPILNASDYKEIFESFLGDLPVVIGAKEALDELHQKGVSIHIITAREPWAEQTTKDWLASREIAYDTLTCCSTKHGKVARAIDLGCVGAIDDHPQVLAMMAGAGITSALLDTSYNKLLSISPVIRRLTWAEVPDFVSTCINISVLD